MKDMQEHWDSVFANNVDPELGWYERDVSQTLKFLEDRIPEHSTIFLPGAGTSNIVEELLAPDRLLILNDISPEALNRLKSRIGERAGIHWLLHDMSKRLPGDMPEVDFWIDRAVLHFLTNPEDIRHYFENLKSLLKANGYVLLAEFSKTGAAKCAGLDLHRYSIEEMKENLGDRFTLIEQEEFVYTNPSGDPRPYIYGLFRRDG